MQKGVQLLVCVLEYMHQTAVLAPQDVMAALKPHQDVVRDMSNLLPNWLFVSGTLLRKLEMEGPNHRWVIVFLFMGGYPFLADSISEGIKTNPVAR